MNVCIDVGNTTINVGIFQKGEIIERLSFTTDVVKTRDEYATIIQSQIIAKKIDISHIDKIIFSSVVPTLNIPLKGALVSVFHHQEIMLIEPGIKTGLMFKVDNPLEVGNDLIADLVGAKALYGYPTVIVDMGTATKILLLDETGSFSSALFMPGISISAESLTNKAALLPSVSLDTPKNILAKNTIEAMNAGIVYGHAEMISGLVKRMEKKLGYPVKRILTGGGSIYVKEILKDDFIYNLNLNLLGLNLIIEKNGDRHEK